MKEFKDIPLDSFIWSEYQKNTEIIVTYDLKDNKILELKNNPEFILKTYSKYIDLVRKHPLSLYCEKRDRRFVIKTTDSIFYKTTIIFEYLFSGLDLVSRLKRSLFLSFCTGGLFFFFNFQCISKIFLNIFGYFIGWIFEVLVNLDTFNYLHIPNIDETFSFKKIINMEFSFILSILKALKVKVQTIVNLYLTWPNMKMWTFTHWGIFCAIALKSLLWVDYFITDVFTTSNILKWTNYDLAAALVFLTGYVVSIVNTIHCVEPIHYMISSSLNSAKTIIYNMIPKEHPMYTLSWEKWEKLSREPKVKIWSDYFKLWLYRFRHASGYPWNSNNIDRTLDSFEKLRECQKEVDRLQAYKTNTTFLPDSKKITDLLNNDIIKKK